MIYYCVLKSAPAKKRSAGAFAIISDVANAFLQDYQNEKNRDFQEHMLDRQQQYQNELNANSALIQRQSLERAGLNPNLMSGAPPYGTASVLGDSSSQQAPQVDPSVFNVIAQMQQNQPLVDAQTRMTNAQAEALEIANKHKQTVDRHLDAYFKSKFPVDVKDGEFVKTGSYRSYNQGTLDALKAEREWENRSKQLDALDVQYQVERLVNDERLVDSPTIQSIAKMPFYEKKKLYQEALNLQKDREVMDSVIRLNDANASLADSQESLNNLQEEIQRNSNLAELIHKYLGDGPMADAAMFIAILLSGLNGNINIGAHVSKFKGKTESKSSSTNTNYNNSKSNSHVTVTKE